MSATLTAPVDIGTLITRSADIKDGAPRIAGTGVTVKRIVGWRNKGLNPEEIAREVGHLTVGHVFAALAYYHANTAEIDAALKQEEDDHDRLAAEASAMSKA
jgi:uncharacterized protein (DUF433 family)